MAENLSDWAVKGKEYTVQPQVEKLIKGFHGVGKPLAMCCISPVLAARALPGCEITVGQDKECERWVIVVCVCVPLLEHNSCCSSPFHN